MPAKDTFERAIDEAISNAIDGTSNEIFDAAFGKEESTLDETGDRALEAMGEGLEGEIEAEQDESEDDSDGETEGEEEAQGEGEEDGEAKDAKPDAKADTDAKAKPDAKAEPEGRIPPGKLREANERARAAEAKLAELTKTGEAEKTQFRRQLDELNGKLNGLTQVLQQRQQPDKTPVEAEKPKRPDLFEDPDGFANHLESLVTKAIQPLTQQQENTRVAVSFQIAHATQKDAFEKAIAEVQKLDPNNPESRSTVQRIWGDPDPGSALLRWHRNSETLREVGEDPAAYRARIQSEARDALMKDPEFRKQLLADLRTEAEGSGNTTFTPPRSLNGVRGSRVAVDTSVLNDDPQAIFDSAFEGH